MKQGEIYLVQWDPSVGHEFKKTRPAIVLSSADVLMASNLVTFVAITRTTQSPINDDIALKRDAKNRLTEDSLIKVHHINSFDKQRIIHYIGEIASNDMKKLKTYLRKHFGL